MNKDKNTLLARARENRFLFRCVALLGFSSAAPAGSVAPAGLEKNKIETFGSLPAASLEQKKEFIAKTLTRLDIRREADKRADWVMTVALDSISGQLGLITAKNSRQAKQMIKKMVNTVSPGSYYDGINYCIGAVMYSYKNLSKNYADFAELLPAEGSHNGLWCRGFISAMNKKHADRVKRSSNLVKEITAVDEQTGHPKYKPGTLVFVKNGDSYHALTFEKLNNMGQPEVISFNNNHRSPLKNWSNQGYIVDVRGIIADTWVAKSRDREINKLDWVNQIYRGREHELKHIIAPKIGEKTFIASPQMFAQFNKRHNLSK